MKGARATVFSPRLLRTGTPTPAGYIELTADEAHAEARREGLTLQLSEKTASGFKGVSKMKGARPYGATVSRNGDKFFLGSFATPEQAALECARHLEVPAKLASATAAEPPLSAREALAAAKREDLTLERSETNASGYKGVSTGPTACRWGFRAYVQGEGGRIWAGCFATAEEAALILARRLRRAEVRRPAKDGERDECPICLETLSSVADIVATKCGHVFCRVCLVTHFGDDRTADCPSCRHKLIKGEESSVDRPEAPPPERKRSRDWSLAEQKNMPSLIMKRTRAADSSQAGPSSAPPKVYPFSAAQIGQDAGRLPRRPRSCQRLGLPDWRPPPADPEQSA